MPRTARIEFAGACFHVINRGNYRHNIFDSEGARAAFERTLFEACERFHWKLHAFVIMRNHFHLALETPEPNLSGGMKWLQGTWVSRFNRLRGIVGRSFQGRFKSIVVEPGHALAEVAHYIHLNPVRAGVVEGDRVGEFRWSSFHHFLGRTRLEFLDGFTVRSETGGLPDTRTGWKRYGEYLAFRASEEPVDRDKRFRHLSRGWCIGSDEYREEVRTRLEMSKVSDPRVFVGSDSGQRQRERERIWEILLESAIDAAGTSLNELPAQKSDPTKVMIATALKTTSDVSNGWLANRLAMGKPASVSQFVRRFRLGPEGKSTRYQAILSRVKKCPLN